MANRARAGGAPGMSPSFWPAANAAPMPCSRAVIWAFCVSALSCSVCAVACFSAASRRAASLVSASCDCCSLLARSLILAGSKVGRCSSAASFCVSGAMSGICRPTACTWSDSSDSCSGVTIFRASSAATLSDNCVTAAGSTDGLASRAPTFPASACTVSGVTVGRLSSAPSLSVNAATAAGATTWRPSSAPTCCCNLVKSAVLGPAGFSDSFVT